MTSRFIKTQYEMSFDNSIVTLMFEEPSSEYEERIINRFIKEANNILNTYIYVQFIPKIKWEIHKKLDILSNEIFSETNVKIIRV